MLKADNPDFRVDYYYSFYFYKDNFVQFFFFARFKETRLQTCHMFSKTGLLSKSFCDSFVNKRKIL